MIRKAIAILLIVTLTGVGTASADSDLEGAVASLFFPREHSTYLQELAQQRAIEISTDFSHNGWPSQTGGEVITWNRSGAMEAAQTWLNSPAHNAVLSGPWTQIGCGSYTVGDRYYAVCLVDNPGQTVAQVQVAPVPTPPAPTPAPVILPDTALPKP